MKSLGSDAEKSRDRALDGVDGDTVAASKQREGNTTQVARLIDLGHRRFAVVQSEGRTFAVPRSGGELHRRVAHLTGQGTEQLDSIIVDLGWADGQVVVIEDDSWSIRQSDECPVLFARCGAAKKHPAPTQTGIADLDLLRRHVNVPDSCWPLVLTWLVAFHCDGPAPVLVLAGQAGTGKSSAARRLIDLVDPQVAPLRSAPRSEADLMVAARGSAAFAWDNVSKIPVWLSDALCQIVTGAGYVVRQLYSDLDLVSVYLRRRVVITTIDAGPLRGDLASRFLPITLEPLDASRATESELDAMWAVDRPRVLGAMFTFIAQVLAALPGAEVPAELRSTARMADFALIAAAVDRVLDNTGVSSGALKTYVEGQVDVQLDVAEADPVAVAIHALMVDGTEGIWRGPWRDLLEAISTYRPSNGRDDWPTDSHALSTRVTRLASALAAMGLMATQRKSNGVRLCEIRVVADPSASLHR